MTGFDPTAPLRDTEQDAPDEVPDNVVPPEDLTGTAPAASPAASSGDEPESADPEDPAAPWSDG